MSEDLSSPRWRKFLPDWPQRRYTVHAGTNAWSDWWSSFPGLVRPSRPGEGVDRFEAAAAHRTGCRHAVAFGAGRMALYAILEAMAFVPGDEVVVPGFTCAVVPNAMRYRGLRPVYADIEARTFNADPEAVAAAVSPATKAIYLQHTFGLTADVARLRAIASRHGLALIEDLAHSLGARHDGRLHGALGDVAYFSTDRTKIVNTHLGGCAITNDDQIAGRLRAIQGRLAAPGGWLARRMVASFQAEFFWRDPMIFWLGRPVLGALRRGKLTFTWADESLDTVPTDYPYPCRMLPSLAEIGRRQLEQLDSNLAHRRKIARWLEQRVGWYDGSLNGDFDDQAWLRYSFLVRDADQFDRRFGKNIELGRWFPHNIFGREHDAASVGYVAGSCPVAERICQHIVNLPTHSRLPLELFEALWAAHGGWLTSQIIRGDIPPEGRNR